MAKIAICGYGVVGSGVAEVIAENAESIARNAAAKSAATPRFIRIWKLGYGTRNNTEVASLTCKSLKERAIESDSQTTYSGVHGTRGRTVL